MDIWVNNAGITQAHKATLQHTDAEELRRIIDTNLLGSIFGARAALQASRARPAHVFCSKAVLYYTDTKALKTGYSVCLQLWSTLHGESPHISHLRAPRSPELCTSSSCLHKQLRARCTHSSRIFAGYCQLTLLRHLETVESTQTCCCKCGTSADVLPVLQVMREQETGGKIFFIDGTGAWGNPTPQNVAYGAAKRAITQVKVSLLAPHPRALWVDVCCCIMTRLSRSCTMRSCAWCTSLNVL